MNNDLIYDLIFSKETEFTIYIGKYISDIYKYTTFIKEMKSVLKLAEVVIIKESIDILAKDVKWSLKIKK